MQNINTINIKALRCPIDNLCQDMITFKQGDDLSFRVAIFKDDETLANLDNIVNLRFEIYNTGNYQSPSPRSSTLLLQKVVAIDGIDTSLSVEDWDCETSQHATFEVCSEESSLEAGAKWLKISAELEDQKLVTLSAGWIEIEENFTPYKTEKYENILEWKNAALIAAESAEISATSASESAQIASEIATAISNAVSQASEAANSASTSASSASDSAESASEYASIASAKAESASNSAISAAASASSASASAEIATERASFASDSASLSDGYAEQASLSEMSATESATTATAKATEASESASSASSSATSASASATSASASATSASASATSAAASASEATQVVGLQALSAITQKKSEVYFPYYSRAYKSSVDVFPNFPITMCVNAAYYNHDNTTSTTYSGRVLFMMTNASTYRAVYLYYDTVTKYISASIATGYNAGVSVRKYYPLEEGKMYNFIWQMAEPVFNDTSSTYNATGAKLYIDGVDIGATAYGTTSTAWSPADDETFGVYFNQSSNLMLDSRRYSVSKIKDARIFNFALPYDDEADTDGIGYTMQDYVNGLDVPVELQSSSATNRCIFSSMNTIYTAGSTKYLMSEIGGDLTCVASTSSINTGDLPQSTDENRFNTQMNAIIANTPTS